MTPRQIELARHALGLPNEGRRSFRKHFVAGPGHADYADWQSMIAGGFAIRRAGGPISGGDDIFFLTLEGALAALEEREYLSDNDFPGGRTTPLNTPLNATGTMPTILRAIVLHMRDLTVTEAAERLGIGRPALSNVLNGNADLSVELAAKIEDVFRYSALWLLQLQVEKKLATYRQITGSTIFPVRAPAEPPRGAQ